MKILRKNKELDIIPITYFKILDYKYLIYTTSQNTKDRIIYIAKLIDEYKLILPEEKELNILKNLIKNFLSERVNIKELKDIKYEYTDIKEIENRVLKEQTKQKIILSTEKYLKLLSNKYLTYPELKIINMEEIMKEGYDKNNEEATNICISLLLLYFIFIIIFQIILIILDKSKLSLYTLTGPTLILWTLVISLFSMVAYNFEEKNIIESWLTTFLIIFIFLLLLNLILGNLLISYVALKSLIYSIFFTIPYTISKKISFKIVNKLKARNYLTYFCIYLVPFALIFIGLFKLYNKYIIDYVNLIINKF